MSTLRGFALAAFVIGVVGGVGCKDKAKEQPSVYQDPLVFCADLTGHWATFATECAGITPEAARAAIGYLIDCDRIHAAIQAGRATYDANVAQTCIDGFRGRSCDVGLDDAVPDACSYVLTGLVTPGGECTLGIDVECAGGWCSIDACDAPGACVAYRMLGQTCLGPSQLCHPNLWCNEGICQTPATPAVHGEGQPCGSAAIVCASGLYCSYPQIGDPTCQPRKTSGYCQGDQACVVGYACRAEACSPWLEPGDPCVQGPQKPCVLGAYCGTDGFCHPWASVGGTCGPIGDYDWIECIDSWCDLGGSGTCTAYLAPGAACDVEGPSSQCGPGHACEGAPATCVEWYCGGLG
jgi:hypothetical protein